MSIELQGTLAQKKKLEKELRTSKPPPTFGVNGSLGTRATVPTDTPGHLQRATKMSTVLKMGRFDPMKFTSISVARLPDGTLYTYDGDHRRHLWGMTFGYDGQIPAEIKDVKDMAEYHLLFADANGDGRKNLNPNEIFFHKFLGNDPEALRIGKYLKLAGLALNGSPDDPKQGRIGRQKDPLVSIGGFRKALTYDFGNVAKAVSTLKLAWPKASTIQTELLSAMALLYKTYPILMTGRKGAKIPAEFEAWFKNHISITDQKKMARKWKVAGGNVHHKATESVAMGILKEFISVNLPNGSTSKQNILPRGPLKDLLESK